MGSPQVGLHRKGKAFASQGARASTKSPDKGFLVEAWLMQMKSRHVRIRPPEYGWYRYNLPSTVNRYVPIHYNRTTTEKKRTSYFGDYKGKEQ